MNITLYCLAGIGLIWVVRKVICAVMDFGFCVDNIERTGNLWIRVDKLEGRIKELEKK